MWNWFLCRNCCILLVFCLFFLFGIILYSRFVLCSYVYWLICSNEMMFNVYGDNCCHIFAVEYWFNNFKHVELSIIEHFTNSYWIGAVNCVLKQLYPYYDYEICKQQVRGSYERYRNNITICWKIVFGVWFNARLSVLSMQEKYYYSPIAEQRAIMMHDRHLIFQAIIKICGIIKSDLNKQHQIPSSARSVQCTWSLHMFSNQTIISTNVLLPGR